MLVMLRMLPAFVRTQPAGDRAGVKKRRQHLDVMTRPTSPDRARRGAKVGAVEVQPNALAELREPLLCEAGVGAGGACLCAGIAFLDAAEQRAILAASNVGMAGDHLPHLHRIGPFVWLDIEAMSWPWVWFHFCLDTIDAFDEATIFGTP